MLDPCLNKHGADPESREAWATVKQHARDTRMEVLVEISLAGEHGLTCEEAAAKRGLASYRLSGRFTELKARGLIEVCGRRFTQTMHHAKAYKVTTKGTETVNRQLHIFP